ncbi:response regulator transcription factor [Streptococcus mutans]|jgi:putative response regulator|uniref:response regulator transcription factor n=1 Tax=Streptococcus mutans TaxID=1309 RepID=UPI0002B528FB|nr:response regulator transcription factor [Streptococcus mutans]EMB79246.1 putative response regulator [Streptococcus mutans 5SM3]EMP68546.1 response regulator [Streptococcus mutans NCTC 11060]MCB4948513.1 response regulator transcription factor [Streptococcus mutans]MCB4959946.1 response regulator transcription factor [Streptococcus mutans]MCB4978064.1 response regulator transcription factor [Streptococcus mutans]
MTRILVIDDDADILALIKNTLQLQNYMVKTFVSANQVDRSKLADYDLILLDIMMPDVDGLSFCRDIRNLVDCPILFLTAKSQEADVVTGLSYGADDYICKPFGVQELLARVDAHLRRERREHHASLVLESIRFDLSAKRVTAKGKKLDLTKSEYEICELLAKRRGQVFSKDQLYDYLYAYEERGTPAAIAEHIKNIRAKFRTIGLEPIETVWGIGYKWK